MSQEYMREKRVLNDGRLDTDRLLPRMIAVATCPRTILRTGDAELYIATTVYKRSGRFNVPGGGKGFHIPERLHLLLEHNAREAKATSEKQRSGTLTLLPSGPRFLTEACRSVSRGARASTPLPRRSQQHPLPATTIPPSAATLPP